MRGIRVERPRPGAEVRVPLPDDGSRGSAMVLAMFILVLVTGLGIALLNLSQIEMQMSRANSRASVAFYLAESGLEDARETMRLDTTSSLTDMLTTAAGGDGAIDFSLSSLVVNYDASGNVTGLAGYDDDVPLRDLTAFGDGWYAAFLTNDALDGKTTVADANDRVLITAVGFGPRRSVKTAEAVVERNSFPQPPATITILGDAPQFEGGLSTAKLMSGDDCGSTPPSVPVVGVVGTGNEAAAEAGMDHDWTFVEGTQFGYDTIDELNPGSTINPLWIDCDYLLDLRQRTLAVADVVGDASTSTSSFGTEADPKVVFIDDDYTIGSNTTAGGLLWVTGTLTITADITWDGVIFLIGDGELQMQGTTGYFEGAFVVAKLSGADGVSGTVDDCAGPDGIFGTSDDGFEPGAAWLVTGPGDGTTRYCSTDVNLATRQFPFEVIEFRQR